MSSPTQNPFMIEPIDHNNPAALVKRLTNIGIALSSTKDLNQTLETILIEAMGIANAEGGTLYHLNAHNALEFSIIRNSKLKMAYGGSYPDSPIPPMPLIDDKTGVADKTKQAVFCVTQKQAINIKDIYQSDQFDFSGVKAFDTENNYRTYSMLTLPMLDHHQEVFGCLQLINARDHKDNVIAFDTHIQQIIASLASQAAIILSNKELINAQKELLESFIMLIAKAIDAKSPYTGAHCERVPMLTNMLAEAACKTQTGLFKDFDMSEEEKYELHIAGWIHDCGKVTTPVHIMDKATKLEAIYDRIHLVQARFEILKRDAHITMLEALIQSKANKDSIQKSYQESTQEMDDDIAFIIKHNTGGEFLADETIERLQAIANKYQYTLHGKTMPILSEDELYNLMIRRGTLTAEDRKIMEDHMVQTCAMLEALPFPKHLQRVPEYAGGHHERMDGKGYPKAIKAGDMSIPARMMAIADVFEALTASDRPYKGAKKLSESMRIIGFMKKEHHLDPDIVDFFITSGVYREYAKKFLDDALIDEVDEDAILAIRPE